MGFPQQGLLQPGDPQSATSSSPRPRMLFQISRDVASAVRARRAVAYASARDAGHARAPRCRRAYRAVPGRLLRPPASCPSLPYAARGPRPRRSCPADATAEPERCDCLLAPSVSSFCYYNCKGGATAASVSMGLALTPLPPHVPKYTGPNLRL